MLFKNNLSYSAAIRILLSRSHFSQSCFHKIKFEGDISDPRTVHGTSTLTVIRTREFVTLCEFNFMCIRRAGYPGKKIYENTSRVGEGLSIRADTTGNVEPAGEDRDSADTSALLQMKT